MHKDVITIRDLRFESGLSKENFADAIGISVRQLSRYMRSDCDDIPVKVINSARWVVSQRKKTA